jgi:hypothetical protein
MTKTGAATWTKVLTAHGACAAAINWAAAQPSFAHAWNVCERGDWLLWWMGRTRGGDSESPERRKLVLAACQCARLVLPYVKAGELRPLLRAIETTERWAGQEAGVTLNDVRNAADAASAAASAASYAAAASAAASAASAASYAAYAAYAASYANNREATLKQCADIVRATYPKGR